MQTRSKLKAKKQSTNDFQSYKNQKLEVNEYVPIGSLCNDGTFTQKIGQGAGSYHGGIKTVLYAKKQQFSRQQAKILMQFKMQQQKRSPISTKQEYLCSKCKIQQSEINTNKSKASIQMKQSRQKLKTKKVCLKDHIKTKSKKMGVYQQVQEIFKVFYKDQLTINPQMLDDFNLLLMAAICNLQNELHDSDQTVKALEDEIAKLKKLKSPITLKDKQLMQSSTLKKSSASLEIKSLQIQNQQLQKQINKLQKQNQKLAEKNKLLIAKGKEFEKMVKKVDPTIFEKLEINSSKFTQQKNNKTIRKSENTKESTSKAPKNKSITYDNFSYFTDSSQAQDPDYTIREIVSKLL